MKTADLCIKVSRPADKVEGNKAHYFNTVGKAFMNDKGDVTIKMYAIPINFNGELFAYFNNKTPF